MTALVVIMIGVGLLMVASALDNTPIITTAQKILSNQEINWSGSNQITTTTANVPGYGPHPTVHSSKSAKDLLGTACSPNGAAIFTSDGTILSCQSGKWSLPASVLGPSSSS